MNKFRLSVIGVAIGALLPGLVFAHVTGNSWEQVYNQYKVDVGYDSSNFVVGEPARFDFNVVREKDGQEVPFADAWVRVYQGDKTFFATGIHRPSLGRAGMTFTFPHAGNYNMNVRFENSGESIVDATFPITVSEPITPPAPKPWRLLPVIAWVGWLVAVLLIAYFVAGKRKLS